MKTNITKVCLIVSFLFFTFSVFTLNITAASDTPGSESDPVVTKSYVDSQIAQLKNTGVSSDGYKSVKMTAGQKFIGNEGTEVILRSGEATAIDNGANGVSDISAGKDLMTGNKVELNHLLLIPRTDGRGIVVSTEAYIMVRGSYSIQ